jgi:hypothetical protein
VEVVSAQYNARRSPGLQVAPSFRPLYLEAGNDGRTLWSVRS